MKDAEPGTTHHVSRNDLVLENVLRFSIQLVSELVDPSDLVFDSGSIRIAEQTPDRFSDEGCPIRRNLVDLFGEIVGNGDVDAHSILVS
jgi:hypothetical protein